MAVAAADQLPPALETIMAEAVLLVSAAAAAVIEVLVAAVLHHQDQAQVPEVVVETVL